MAESAIMKKMNVTKELLETHADTSWLYTKSTCTYEEVYYSLWEMSQRYQKFCEFRVIGKSHDDRMIPMMEIGTGSEVIFCVSGMDGTQGVTTQILLQIAEEYCRAYECGWQLENFYEAKKLLDRIRICMIPLVNPDGCEICQNGFSVIRNPIFRQMLRMQNVSPEDFKGNARGIKVFCNFPTVHFARSRMGEEPASENETKAVIRIIQEYGGRGLLSFGQSGREIIYFHSEQGVGSLPKSYRLARHMKKSSSYHLEREKMGEPNLKKIRGMGTLEQYYIQTVKQPAFRIKIPAIQETKRIDRKNRENIYGEVHLLPLEYIFSLVN